MTRAEAGNTDPLVELLPAMVDGGVAAVSANGVLGDPTGATAEDGARLLAEMTRRAVESMDTQLRSGGSEPEL